MSIETSLMYGVAFVIVVALVLLIAVGVYATAVWLAKSFTRWLSRNEITKERRRGRLLLARQQELATEREEAMLRGASALATQLVKTVVDAQLTHMSTREAEYQQLLLELTHSKSHHRLPKVALLDVESPINIDVLHQYSCSPSPKSPRVAAGILPAILRLFRIGTHAN